MNVKFGHANQFLIHVSLMAAVVTCPGPTGWVQAADTAATAPATAVSMSLKEFVAKLRANNKTILSKKIEAEIAGTGIDRAGGVFQPAVTAAATRSSSKQKNTFEEGLIRQGLDAYERDANDYSVSVTELVAATGAKLEEKISLSRFLTNNDRLDPSRPDDAQNNRSTAALSLMQPLARDAGRDVTEARLNVARLDNTVADLTRRDTETSVVAEATMAYYELVFAQQRVAVEAEKIRMGERLLQDSQDLHRHGRLSESDVWEVENALARYQSAHNEALQSERELGGRLRTMLMMGDPGQVIRASDALPAVDNKAVSFELSLQTALEHRADFQMRKVQIEREGIQLAYTKNQTLPRIDLVSSYAINGLEYSTGDAFSVDRMSNYSGWTLGLQFSAPLGANRQAEADLKAAALRHEDAILGVKAIEIQIANDIDKSLAMCQSTAERWALWRQVKQREAQQLAVERKKFAAGRSDVREILLREERVAKAGLQMQEQQAGFARAQALLEAAQGTLMDQHGFLGFR